MTDSKRRISWCNWGWPTCGLFLGLLFLLMLLGRNRLLNDSDTFWHIAVGEQILSERQLVRVDSFTFTFAGERWIANQWLGESLMALIDDVGGFDGLVFVAATMLAAIFALAGHRMLDQGVNWLLVFGIVALAISTAAYGLLARPKVFSIVALGLVYLTLLDVESGKLRLGTLFWLIPLFVIWGNIHGAVLGGIGTLTVVFAGWTIRGKVDSTMPVTSVQQLSVLTLIFVGCLVALVISPYGLETPRAWYSIMSLPLSDLIIEHQPMELLSPYGLMALIGMAAYLLLLLASPEQRFRPALWMPLVWFLLCLTRSRYIPLYAVVTLFAVAEVLPQSSLANVLKRRDWIRPTEVAGRVSKSAMITCAAVLISLAVVVAVGKQDDSPHGLWAHPTPEVWPVELLADFRSLEAAANDELRVFNEPRVSGFLIYNADNTRVFIDGRCELFGESFMRQFLEGYSNPELLDQWDSQYRFDAALVLRDSSYFDHLQQSEHWNLLKATPVAALFARKRP